jgi:energy-coupling factor transporter ATP-binding protein EcfA2
MLQKLILKGHPTVADAVINFEKGFNLLTAPNGRGKSTVLEMVAYCLFGTAALRGNLEDFPTLDCQLLFKLRDKSLRVVRSKKETMLYEGNTPMAGGTTPVNAAILRLMGYGLKVYNVANHIRQGQVNALTDRLRPEDRRQVLENTVGLTVIDKVISELNKVLLESAADLKASVALQVQPICPEMPKGFIPLADREEVLGSHKAFALSYRNAKAKLVKAVEPVTPNGIILDTESLEKLREDVKAWSAKRVWVEQATMQVNQLVANRKRLQSTAPEQPLGVLPREALLAMADLDKQIGLLEQERGLLTQPRLTQQEIDADRKRAKVYKLVQKYREVAAHEVDCPNCGHDFVPNCDGQLEDLSLQLNKLLDSHTCGQLLNGNQEAEKGQYSEATLIAEEMRQPNEVDVLKRYS